METFINILKKSSNVAEQQTGNRVEQLWSQCDKGSHQQCRHIARELCKSLNAFSLPALRLVAQQLDIDSTGTKKDLCKRLVDYDSQWSQPDALEYLPQGSTSLVFHNDNFMDPISFQLMKEPFVANDGNTYELQSLRQIAERGPTMRMANGEDINLNEPIYFNRTLFKMIQEWAEQHYNVHLDMYTGPNTLYLRRWQNAEEIAGELVIAAREGRLEVVRLLLEHNADVNTQDNDNYTALIAAAFGGHLEIVRLLLERNADVNARDGTDMTALHHAAQHRADLGGIVRLLLMKGADVNARDGTNMTALHHAAQNGNFQVVRLLLEYNADVNAEDDDGDTALMIAALDGDLEIAHILQENPTNRRRRE